MERPVSFENVIGGRRVPSRSGAVLESVDPSTGAVWATVPRSEEADVAAAVDAARAAFEQRWRPLPALARAGHLRGLAEMLRAHATELAELETRDNGRIIVETTLFDLPACTEMLHYFAGAADKISGDTVQIALDGELLRTHRARHDKTKEFGALGTPRGRPRKVQDVA